MKIEVNNQEVDPENIKIKEKVGALKKDGKPDCGYVYVPKGWIGETVNVINSKEVQKKVKLFKSGRYIVGVIYLPLSFVGKSVIVIRSSRQ